MTTPSLFVFWDQNEVGTLTLDKGSRMQFQYSKIWVEKNGAPISISLPVRKERYEEEAHRFFANLLPEGDARKAIERTLKISSGNDYSLLRAIGGDCAGALSISDELASHEGAYYQDLSQEDLLRYIKTRGETSLGPIRSRLSLAGAQGKLPVREMATGFELPFAGAPSTHILKFNSNSEAYPCLTENEFLVTSIAKCLGLHTIECKLQKIADEIVFVSKRYDRDLSSSWARRLHQEDFCQGLGIGHSNKYQKEGGPSFRECIGLVRTELSLLEVNSLLDWFFFNFIVGNCDAHGKNLSILFADGDASPTLSPFYDLVVTHAYPNLDKNMAMALGNEFNSEGVREKHFKAFANEIGVTFPFVRQRFRDLLDSFPEALGKAKTLLLQQPNSGVESFAFLVKTLEERFRFVLRECSLK